MHGSLREKSVGPDQIFLPSSSLALHAFFAWSIRPTWMETSAFLVRKGNVAARARLVALPFFNDRLFSLSEDLILAEERTTERDRKKITEGETRAIKMVSFHALILWGISCLYPPLLRCLIMPRASTASRAVAPFIIYARFGWQRPAQRARESGELGRKEHSVYCRHCRRLHG